MARINDVTKYRELFESHPMTNNTLLPLIDKAQFIIQDGLFAHHATFCYIDNGCFYYLEFFAKGYKKRRIVDGLCKYLNALMLNPETGEYYSRYDYENGKGLISA